MQRNSAPHEMARASHVVPKDGSVWAVMQPAHNVSKMNSWCCRWRHRLQCLMTVYNSLKKRLFFAQLRARK